MKIVRPDAVEPLAADQESCFAVERYGNKETIVISEQLKLRLGVDEAGGLGPGVLGYSNCCLLSISICSSCKIAK